MHHDKATSCGFSGYTIAHPVCINIKYRNFQTTLTIVTKPQLNFLNFIMQQALHCSSMSHNWALNILRKLADCKGNVRTSTTIRYINASTASRYCPRKFVSSSEKIIQPPSEWYKPLLIPFQTILLPCVHIVIALEIFAVQIMDYFLFKY